jgi:hypothetical protein
LLSSHAISFDNELGELLLLNGRASDVAKLEWQSLHTSLQAAMAHENFASAAALHDKNAATQAGVATPPDSEMHKTRSPEHAISSMTKRRAASASHCSV